MDSWIELWLAPVQSKYIVQMEYRFIFIIIKLILYVFSKLDVIEEMQGLAKYPSLRFLLAIVRNARSGSCASRKSINRW